MLDRQPSWKNLVLQAVEQGDIALSGRQKCGLICIRRYVYDALKTAGINNRIPLSWWQLLQIRLQSGGDPARIRLLCHKAIEVMQTPAFGFSNNFVFPMLCALLASLIFVLFPKIATTSKAPVESQHILNYIPQPMDDNDLLENQLPLSSDYHEIASTQHFLLIQSLRSTQKPADHRWIAMQPDHVYSLQLVSASDPKPLTAYCQKHQICEQSSIYQTEVDGRKTVRLLYGVFDSHRAAKQAISALPPALRQSRPWARPLSQIKKEL